MLDLFKETEDETGMNWKAWIHSIIAAAIGGAATAVGAILISPASFPMTLTGWQHIGIVAAFGAFVPVLAILKQSPLPGSTFDPASGGVQSAGKPVSVVAPISAPTVLIAPVPPTTPEQPKQ